MTCAVHPERAATAFCQNCGKPLCPECTRSADRLLLCEPCLLARYPQAAAGGFASTVGTHSSAASYAYGANPEYTSVPYAAVPYAAVPGAAGQQYRPRGASPVIAGLLGFIPGVGAMYNGQFVKALLHVLIFIVLVGISQHFDLAGILVAAWIFYQVFDAAQTAAARRDGLPLPDPFGILNVSARLGPQSAANAPPSGYTVAPPAMAQPGAPRQAYDPVPPPARGEPVGALVLIALGLLFLMNTLGFFNGDWVGRFWPIALLLVGVWLLVRRAHSPHPEPPTAGGRHSSFSRMPDPAQSKAHNREDPR